MSIAVTPTETPSLFPTPPIPEAARGELTIARTSAAVMENQLAHALRRGGWDEAGRTEIARMIAASASLQKQLQALLLPGGKAAR